MIVITPHPTEELKLIKYQKELIRRLFTPGALIYAHQPLWIPAQFESIEQAKKEIKSVTVLAPEYDENGEGVFCPVRIQTVGGECLESKLDYIHGLPRFARNDEHCHCERSAAIHTNEDLFPLPLKIFRLGECTSPSPNVYELSSTVWKKL
ncbi:MAG: hypothetical protein J5726_01350 [Treponema sp.]|nr:hypothetical protein [Treponema sp.]